MIQKFKEILSNLSNRKPIKTFQLGFIVESERYVWICYGRRNEPKILSAQLNDDGSKIIYNTYKTIEYASIILKQLNPMITPEEISNEIRYITKEDITNWTNYN